mmetsp:Transcript_23883/g.68010  ORF Transcript_23883/g.68010 Transcript_23883/m.68010 type:complete len:264 (-) Transcript_23883:69-860(-)
MGGAMGRLPPEEDARRYREGYPGQRQEEDPKKQDNALFYTNRLKSRGGMGDGEYIDVMHAKWFGDYERLEYDHGYIQWLFPIREPGMNFECQPLTSYEIEAMLPNAEVKARLVKSYRLILDFFGLDLADESAGTIKRKENGWRARVDNLNESGHNYLRITRILKCLGELGYPHYQAPLCDAFLHEVFETKELRNCAESLAGYWIPVVKDDAARERLKAAVSKHMPGYYDQGPPKGKGKGMSDSRMSDLAMLGMMEGRMDDGPP